MTALSILSALALAVSLMIVGRRFVTEELHVPATDNQRESATVSIIGIACLALMSLLTAFAMLDPAQFQTELTISAIVGLISGVGFLVAAITQGPLSKSWPIMLLTLAVYARAFGLTHPNKLQEANLALVVFVLGALLFVVFQIIYGAYKRGVEAEQERKRTTAHVLLSPMDCNTNPDLWVKHGHHLPDQH